jgi:hypothetical protein
MKLSAVLFGVVLPDYALTVLVAVLDRRPRLLLLGFFFPLLRIVDSMIGLTAIPAGWLVRSNGVWKSPARRAIDGPQERPAPADGQPGRPRRDRRQGRCGSASHACPGSQAGCGYSGSKANPATTPWFGASSARPGPPGQPDSRGSLAGPGGRFAISRPLHAGTYSCKRMR